MGNILPVAIDLRAVRVKTDYLQSVRTVGITDLSGCNWRMAVQKVAVFGNAGGGKSTLSRRLSAISQLPLHVLDKIQYRAGGVKVPEDEYKRLHDEIVAADRWIIDGFGSIETLWPRLDRADTCVYVDLPIAIHGWWVTKRLIKGFFHPPPGWPEGSPLLKSSLNSYRNLWLCHTRLTPRYRDYVQRMSRSKTVYHLRSPTQIAQFLQTVELTFL